MHSLHFSTLPLLLVFFLRSASLAVAEPQLPQASLRCLRPRPDQLQRDLPPSCGIVVFERREKVATQNLAPQFDKFAPSELQGPPHDLLLRIQTHSSSSK